MSPAINISEFLDIDALEQYLREGYIKREVHPLGGLWLFHYTDKAARDLKSPAGWPIEVLCSTGLITDTAYNLVARPPQKVFDWESYEGTIPIHLACKAYEFLNFGELGILYEGPDGQPAIATKYSFDSFMALRATKCFRENHLDEGVAWLLPTHTPVFQLDLDIGDDIEFYFIAAVNKQTGRDMPNPEGKVWNSLRPHMVNAVNPELVYATSQMSEDQLVITFADGLRLRTNFDEYLRLHRMINGYSPKIIWEHLKEGREKTLDDLMRSIPAEFGDWADGVRQDFLNRYAMIKEESYYDFRIITQSISQDEALRQKEFAKRTVGNKNQAVLFAIAAGKDFKEIIWNRLRPKSETPYKIATQSVTVLEEPAKELSMST